MPRNAEDVIGHPETLKKSFDPYECSNTAWKHMQ